MPLRERAFLLVLFLTLSFHHIVIRQLELQVVVIHSQINLYISAVRSDIHEAQQIDMENIRSHFELCFEHYMN